MVVPIELSASDRNTAVRETVNEILPFPLIKPLREGLAGGRTMDKNELPTRELDMDVTKRAFEIAFDTALTRIDPSFLFRIRFNRQLKNILGKPIQDEELRKGLDFRDTETKVTAIFATIALLTVKLRGSLLIAQNSNRFGIEKLETDDVVIPLSTFLDPKKTSLGHLDRGFRVKNVNIENGTIITEDWQPITPGKKEEFLIIGDARDIRESADHALTRGRCLLELAGRLKALHESLLGI